MFVLFLFFSFIHVREKKKNICGISTNLFVYFIYLFTNLFIIYIFVFVSHVFLTCEKEKKEKNKYMAHVFSQPNSEFRLNLDMYEFRIEVGLNCPF